MEMLFSELIDCFRKRLRAKPFVAGIIIVFLFSIGSLFTVADWISILGR
jgi:hypothetical protein